MTLKSTMYSVASPLYQVWLYTHTGPVSLVPTFISDHEIVTDMVEGGDVKLLWMGRVLECHNITPLEGSIRQEITEVAWLKIQTFYSLSKQIQLTSTVHKSSLS